MSIVQALLLGFIGWIVAGPFLGGMLQWWFKKPLVVSFICGIIMQDMPTALSVGLTLQAMYLGFMTVGYVSSMPEIEMCQWFIIPICIVEGGNVEYAVLMAVAFGTVNTLLGQVMKQLNLINLHFSQSLIRKGKLKEGFLALYSAQIWDFLAYMIIVPACGLLGSDAIVAFAESIPAWVSGILSTFVMLLPLLGFALLLTGLVEKKMQFIFLLLGFVMFKVMKLDIITITIIGTAIAYILFLGSGKNTMKAEGKS